MTLRWSQVIVDSADPERLARWWADALGGELISYGEADFEVRPLDGAGPTLYFLLVPEAKTVKNRLHLDFVPDDQGAEVQRMLALGATRADVGQGDDVSWVVLADPEGNEFCILSASPQGSEASATSFDVV